jgi:hypothetical protein
MTPRVLGCEIFEWFATHPEEGGSFMSAMADLAGLVAGEVARVVDFSSVSSVVDVGGSVGQLLTTILAQHRHLTGILFDLPPVIEKAKPVLARSPAMGRAEAVAGDFFKAIPAGDVFLLKQILHDWNDDQCRKILQNCARAMPSTGRLLLVEMVIPDDRSPSPAAMMDMNMLALLPGKERSAAEYEALLKSAGLKTARLIRTHSPFEVIEAVRA